MNHRHSDITAQQIKDLRKSLGLTQAGFARKLHVTVGSISNWERGMFGPDRHTAPVLAALMKKQLA